jgi:4'-phosphopantetheinyl transferase EntD
MHLIGPLLPNVVASAEAFTDPPAVALFPEEAAFVSRAVDKRRREFASVRYCARQALADLGVGPVAIVPGDRGEPRWPPGIVGTLTHCAGYRAAAVAPAVSVAAVGIDAEPHEPLPEGVLDMIGLPAERAQVAELTRRDSGVAWDRLLFCAKEATYKAWFPLMGAWLGFDEAEITVDPVTRTFTSRLLAAGPEIGGTRIGVFPGRWACENALVATAITLLR